MAVTAPPVVIDTPVQFDPFWRYDFSASTTCFLLTFYGTRAVVARVNPEFFL